MINSLKVLVTSIIHIIVFVTFFTWFNSTGEYSGMTYVILGSVSILVFAVIRLLVEVLFSALRSKHD